ncbi:MAG TPA: hypothetical protein DD473_06630 [Planctomycetaceae bacterium]|nr:hypothetical protein [Planctomycetaceae bacterium]
MFWQNKNPADQFSKASSWSFLLAICISFTQSIGCSNGNPNGVNAIPVSGVITWNGEPLANANVVFRPAETG